MSAMNRWALLVLAGCDPYAGWPDQGSVFPWRYTEQTDLEPYEQVRFETETWVPLVDLEETVLYVQKATYHRPWAPEETLLHFGEMRPAMPPLVQSDVLLSFVGDVMRFEGNWAHFADPVADRLVGLRVGNLETPVSTLHPTDRSELADEHGLYAFNSPPELLDGLPLDVVQLNNNHSLDVGDEGLARTWKEVWERSMTPVGVDENLVLAQSGEIVVGLLSYTWGLNVKQDSLYDLHVVPFGQLDEPVDLAHIERQVRAAREQGATHVVLLLHWGFEYEYYPDPHFLQLGRRLVELGADVIVGSGPHCVQPAEICDVNRPLAVPGIGRCSVRTPDGRPRTAAILYSLGDFGTELATLPLQVGLVATVSLDAGGVSGMQWDPVATVDAPSAGKEIRPLDSLLSDPEMLAEAQRLDVLLGTRWRAAR
jgi:hypothetical protein